MKGVIAMIAFTMATSVSAGFLDVQREKVVSSPMHQFEHDCGTRTTLRFKPEAPAFVQLENVPGAGISKFEAFQTVLKDGFLPVNCVKDYMYYRGDKFGDNRHDYKLGPVSNVSIVHYADHVRKADQVQMTQTVCFEFCRTVPNMGFFGIVNGRGCYCTPYFKPMESDSSQCDSVCEGENTLTCGGVAKSSIFAMHMCDSTEADLGTRTSTARDLEATMNANVSTAHKLSEDMQNMAASLQKSFGAVGDGDASGLMQSAKQSAGTLLHKVEEAEKMVNKLRSLEEDAFNLNDFAVPATVTKAERIMEDIDETVAAGQVVNDALNKLTALASPSPDSANASKQYYPVMYFVDKEFESNPSTCSGDNVADPIVGESKDGCASACDANIHSCVGFQYFKEGDISLCFLLSKFSTGSHYTGCKNPTVESTCFAKLSKFEGTTLKPDGSGKCKQCFKKLTKADRCYSSGGAPPASPPAPPPPAPKKKEKKAAPAPPPPASPEKKKKDSDLVDDNDLGDDDYGDDDYGDDGGDYDGGLDLHAGKPHHKRHQPMHVDFLQGDTDN